MYYQGLCHKMQTTLDREIDLMQSAASMPPFSVYYHLNLDGFLIALHTRLGHFIEIAWTGRIFCMACGKQTPKSYAQGYCFLCFKRVPQTDLCMVKPETCHYHLGTCRDPSFAQQVCFQPHFVYLANSSALKIGITRASNIPTRWLDQGASQALAILQVNSRRLSGQLEHLFAQRIADKTNWRTLLKGNSPVLDLQQQKQQLIYDFRTQMQQLQNQLAKNEIVYLQNDPLIFDYPILSYPQKIVSHNLDKQNHIQGKLYGIKGQYLIMDTGVINLRKYTGYEIRLNVSDI